MKYLTVCQRGNCRSVSMAMVLKDMFCEKDVVACGVDTTSPETFDMLTTWADQIIVVADEAIIEKVKQRVRPENMPKVFCLCIGYDRWGNPANKSLLDMLSRVWDQVMQAKGP